MINNLIIYLCAGKFLLFSISSEPDLIGLQSKESFLAWNDGYENEIKVKSGSTSALPTTPKKVYGDNKDDTMPQPLPPSRNPVIMDIAKNADYLGMQSQQYIFNCV